jgi:hypothetical protein
VTESETEYEEVNDNNDESGSSMLEANLLDCSTENVSPKTDEPDQETVLEKPSLATNMLDWLHVLDRDMKFDEVKSLDPVNPPVPKNGLEVLNTSVLVKA